MARYPNILLVQKVVVVIVVAVMMLMIIMRKIKILIIVKIKMISALLTDVGSLPASQTHCTHAKFLPLTL